MEVEVKAVEEEEKMKDRIVGGEKGDQREGEE